jgi:hypothetical protein
VCDESDLQGGFVDTSELVPGGATRVEALIAADDKEVG